MKTHTLSRLNQTPKQTEGILLIGEETFHTLERPWLNNKPFHSCVPAGTYLVKRDKSGKHQFYAVQGVPGRTNIEIHPMRSVEQSEGCIGLGIGFRGRYLVGSEDACDRFLELIGDNDFYLEITDLTGD